MAEKRLILMQDQSNSTQISIFSGMPSLIFGQKNATFCERWPFNLALPQIPNINATNSVLRVTQNKTQTRQSKNSSIQACQHTHLKPFAKSMCYKCYQKTGRSKKATRCKHTDKPNYAKGLCQKAYFKKLKVMKKVNQMQ